jgi:hypothetical protein
MTFFRDMRKNILGIAVLCVHSQCAFCSEKKFPSD